MFDSHISLTDTFFEALGPRQPPGKPKNRSKEATNDTAPVEPVTKPHLAASQTRRLFGVVQAKKAKQSSVSPRPSAPCTTDHSFTQGEDIFLMRLVNRRRSDKNISKIMKISEKDIANRRAALTKDTTSSGGNETPVNTYTWGGAENTNDTSNWNNSTADDVEETKGNTGGFWGAADNGDNAATTWTGAEASGNDATAWVGAGTEDNAATTWGGAEAEGNPTTTWGGETKEHEATTTWDSGNSTNNNSTWAANASDITPRTRDEAATTTETNSWKKENPVDKTKARYHTSNRVPGSFPDQVDEAGFDDSHSTDSDSWTDANPARQLGEFHAGINREAATELWGKDDLNEREIGLLKRYSHRHDEIKWLHVASMFFDKTGKRINERCARYMAEEA